MSRSAHHSPATSNSNTRRQHLIPSNTTSIAAAAGPSVGSYAAGGPGTSSAAAVVGTRSRKQSSSSGSSPGGGGGCTPNSTRSVMFDDRDPLLPPRRTTYGSSLQQQQQQQQHQFNRTLNSSSPSPRHLVNQIPANSTSQIPQLQRLNSDHHRRSLSNSTSSLTSKTKVATASSDAASTASAPPMTLNNKSRWQRLFSAFRKNKYGHGGNGGAGSHSSDAFCLKHSHNCSNSFLRAGISNMKGYKKANQDRCTAFSYLEGDPELAFFAVYDGHGGTGVANYLKDHLHEFILDQPEYKEGNMEESALKAFMQVDEELRTYGPATELTGSTATVVLIKHGDLICANLGDSRAIASVSGMVKALSTDHNTSNAQERERVYSVGGTIKDNRVGGVLIPTRSFGDFLLKSEQDKPPWKQVISAVPQIQTFHLDTQWEFVIVGSDGVWDAMINQDMISFVRQRLQSHSNRRDKLILSQLCEQILDMCCAKTVGRYGKNSCDNMTIIIIWFDHSKNRHHPTHHHHPHHPGSETGSSVVSSCVSR